jgi:hypothetical protein
MQAVMAEMLAMSELQSRNAPPVHICCASALKAKPDVDTAQRPMATASANPVRRIVLCESEVVGRPLF